jgi:hypothetical protein
MSTTTSSSRCWFIRSTFQMKPMRSFSIFSLLISQLEGLFIFVFPYFFYCLIVQGFVLMNTIHFELEENWKSSPLIACLDGSGFISCMVYLITFSSNMFSNMNINRYFFSSCFQSMHYDVCPSRWAFGTRISLSCDHAVEHILLCTVYEYTCANWTFVSTRGIGYYM